VRFFFHALLYPILYFKYKFRIYTWTLLAVERPVSWEGISWGRGSPASPVSQLDIGGNVIVEAQEQKNFRWRLNAWHVTAQRQTAASWLKALSSESWSLNAESWRLKLRRRRVPAGNKPDPRGEIPEGCTVNLHYIYAYFLGESPAKEKKRKQNIKLLHWLLLTNEAAVTLAQSSSTHVVGHAFISIPSSTDWAISRAEVASISTY